MSYSKVSISSVSFGNPLCVYNYNFSNIIIECLDTFVNARGFILFFVSYYSLLCKILLVGVELNPGPKKKSNMNAKSKVKQVNHPGRNPMVAKLIPSIIQKAGNGVSANIVAPVAIAKVRKMGVAKMSSLPGGNIRITHREYFADLNGSVAFVATQFPINPGMAITFPWLSQIANRYESYSFNRLQICYETESATIAIGTVILAIDYDATDLAPVSKSDVMTYHDAVRSPPWADSCFTASQTDLHKLKSNYTRPGALAANQDLKLYDIGNLFVCTNGQATAANVGELYVDYDIMLMTPQIIPSGEFPSLLLNASTGLSATTLFGTNSTTSGSLPATITSSSTFTFNEEVEVIGVFYVTGTGLNSSGATNSGTATYTNLGGVANAASTLSLNVFIARGAPGSTLILTITAATVSAVTFRFGTYQYSLG